MKTEADTKVNTNLFLVKKFVVSALNFYPDKIKSLLQSIKR